MQYDEYYNKPDEALIKRKGDEYRDLFIEPFFPEDKNVRILDVGCGYGIFLDACRQSGYKNVFGVDFNSEAAKFAMQKLGLENITYGDAFAYLDSAADESFHVITATNFVEHVKKERIPGLFSLVASKLKEDGRFIIELPNADSIHGIHTFFSDLTHEWAYTKALITNLLHKAGFSEVQVHPNRVRSNKLIRLAQKILTKIVSGDDILQYSAHLIVVASKAK